MHSVPKSLFTVLHEKNRPINGMVTYTFSFPCLNLTLYCTVKHWLWIVCTGMNDTCEKSERHTSRGSGYQCFSGWLMNQPTSARTNVSFRLLPWPCLMTTSLVRNQWSLPVLCSPLSHLAETPQLLEHLYMLPLIRTREKLSHSLWALTTSQSGSKVLYISISSDVSSSSNAILLIGGKRTTIALCLSLKVKSLKLVPVSP